MKPVFTKVRALGAAKLTALRPVLEPVARGVVAGSAQVRQTLQAVASNPGAYRQEFLSLLKAAPASGGDWWHSNQVNDPSIQTRTLEALDTGLSLSQVQMLDALQEPGGKRRLLVQFSMQNQAQAARALGDYAHLRQFISPGVPLSHTEQKMLQVIESDVTRKALLFKLLPSESTAYEAMKATGPLSPTQARVLELVENPAARKRQLEQFSLENQAEAAALLGAYAVHRETTTPDRALTATELKMLSLVESEVDRKALLFKLQPSESTAFEAMKARGPLSPVQARVLQAVEAPGDRKQLAVQFSMENQSQAARVLSDHARLRAPGAPLTATEQKMLSLVESDATRKTLLFQLQPSEATAFEAMKARGPLSQVQAQVLSAVENPEDRKHLALQFSMQNEAEAAAMLSAYARHRQATTPGKPLTATEQSMLEEVSSITGINTHWMRQITDTDAGRW